MIIPKTIAEKHQELYDMIPEVEGCNGGCSDCCGPVPFTAWEWSRIEDKRKGNKELTCPYIMLNGKCEIYEKRPLMCRLYGAVEDLKCDKVKTDNLLTKEEAHKILDEYFKLMKKDQD